MIAEAIQAIAKLAIQGREIRTVKTGRFQSQVYLPDDTKIDVVEPHPDLECVVSDLESLRQAAEQYDEESNCTVWITTVGVRMVVEDGYRLDHVDLLLPSSDEWLAIEELPKLFTQRQLIQFLRRHFVGSGVDKLLQAVRRVDFSRKSDGKSVMEHGKESLGKSVEAAVQGSEEIPESITVEVSRWSVPGLRERYPLQLLVEIDVQSEQFYLCCGPNELSLVNDAAMDALRSMLLTTLTPRRVMLGTP